MGIRRKLVTAVCLAALSSLAQPAVSAGSVNFGADLSQLPSGICANCAALTIKTTAGVDAPGASVNGTLVSARIRSSGDPAIGNFRVLRPTGAPLQFLNVGQAALAVSADSSLTGHITEVPAAIPVAIGDRLAVSFPGQSVGFLSPSSAAQCAYRAEPNEPPQAVGAVAEYTLPGCANNEVLVAGTIDPDNSFTVASPRSLKHGRVRLTVSVPNPGVVTAVDAASPGAASTKMRKPLIKPASATTSAPGKVTLTVRPTKVTLKLLKRKPKLKGSLRLTFSPTGGTAAARVAKLKLKRR